MRRPLHALGLLAAVLVAALTAGGCGSSTGAPGGGKLQVVAAENFWGSIATQLAGARADVRSIIVAPDTDPHSYEPTAADARTLAESNVAIVNGIGYDAWASKTLAANPVSGRLVLNVGDLLGLKQGDNPHQWYSPPAVRRVVDAIVADYKRADPADSSYFDRQRTAFEARGLAEYDRLRADIKRRYAGVPVGASESIFVPLAQDLGLDLLTPYSFTKAIAEGTDVSAADKLTVDRQILSHQIRVWVYNSQNSTPDVQRLTSEARSRGIPVTTITETLTPASASFQDWQVAELRSLASALHAGTGR